MHKKPLDELYFTWLYRQVGSIVEKDPSRTYWNLCRVLYTKEYIWLIPNDDNRAADGIDLRIEFLSALKSSATTEWMRLGCSMFELLIGLSRRLAFQDESEPREWFWHLIHNLRLDAYDDATYLPEREINDILDRVIWRTYTGSGDLFPLRNGMVDNSRVELWYQLSAYLLERT